MANPVKLCLCVIALSAAAFATSAMAAEKSDLRVLYVGSDPKDVENDRGWGIHASLFESDEGGDTHKNAIGYWAGRTDEFGQLLSQHFRQVKVVYADDYEESMSGDYDVTIFDSLPKPLGGADEISEYASPDYLSPGFDNASILIGATGPVATPSDSKIDWRCLCLDADAVDPKLDHPIFNMPNKVDLTFQLKETPESFLEHYTGRRLPDRIPMWEVQTAGTFTEPGFPIGMISSGYGFDEAPDGEIIASGVSTKQIDSVALGRHGNFFLWGFAASPKYMTDEAKQVFINTVHYMAQFDGKAPYSRRPEYPEFSEARLAALDSIALAESFPYDEYVQEETEAWENAQKQREAVLEENQGQPETFSSAYDRRLLKQDGPELMTEEEYVRDVVGWAPPKALADRFGDDLDKYTAYYEQNLEYLAPVSNSEAFGSNFLADADVASLGLSNRCRDTLAIAISLMEEPAEKARAQRILARYTGQSFKTAAQWRAWYGKNAPRLYFSDIDGFRFKVAPEETERRYCR